ncbi:hypothetical protein M3A77_05435 [Dermabacter hominis]|nr:HGxxPAAW family protein [Dermabacter hominis]MCT1807350.1 hypothetical protein [Dermabacter hominis]
MAAWVFSAFVLLGSVLIALAMITSQSILLIVGLASVLLALVVGFVLRAAGFGQKAKR